MWERNEHLDIRVGRLPYPWKMKVDSRTGRCVDVLLMPLLFEEGGGEEREGGTKCCGTDCRGL